MPILIVFMLGVVYGAMMVANEDNAAGIMMSIFAFIGAVAAIGYLLWNGLGPLLGAA